MTVSQNVQILLAINICLEANPISKQLTNTSRIRNSNRLLINLSRKRIIVRILSRIKILMNLIESLLMYLNLSNTEMIKTHMLTNFFIK